MIPISKDFPLRLLISYHYYRSPDVLKEFEKYFGDTPLDLFCDSGAFSSFNSGIHVDCQEYIDWLGPIIHGFSLIAALDVIGDPDASHKNYERLKQCYPTANILPTFHVGDPWDLLVEYCRQSKSLALGGMVPFVSRRRKTLRKWLDAAFAIIPKGTRVHGFGLTTWELVHPYPWTSLDSSTWAAWVMYRSLYLYDRERLDWVSISMRTSERLDCLRHTRILDQYGLRVSDIHSPGFSKRKLGYATLAAYRLAEATLSEKRDVPLSVYAVSGTWDCGHVAISKYIRETMSRVSSS